MNMAKLLTPAFALVIASLVAPAPAHAGKMDGINYLISVTQMKASNANAEALEGADKQRTNIDRKTTVRDSHDRFAERVQAEAPSPQVARAGAVVGDVEAIAGYGTTAGADGFDDTEVKRLAELVSTAKTSVDGAVTDASAAITDTKKQLGGATSADDRKALKLRMKSLRATLKAHRKTEAALRTLASELAKPGA